ncbi:UDP-N-acetylmuramoyl-L-alanine--D-glutamate ligase [Alicyclobacillus mali]|uniref:UDP-N-acetylmuramoylalanine--D-glutamate ligase n=1 Tax=Alicyclobacillus mali (ex Roth et al. 2021) TaxID=1123961 RepID=A0ABS0F2S7_9BACL|nr:UDP-N-acetylmuramoyl-L-alanine--D-glutamate ligase [Alicyclobacillus mali (ex Roth et al. 2021)]MBF8377564.1 UDP-N-acetylmuramoyl-L-alanine--D-glutamate ligase [Alicyclobacillus mali (ex Roth et al. 2021)]MCL6489094.1 UDP-N-acetylmuramoyl-L-alanine--D-glutamate ligase [Alicyclobacillus mali (ex Roth et al. 2021)]
MKLVTPETWLHAPGEALVVGLGKSGTAVASLLARRGFRVTATDERALDPSDPAVAPLAALGVDLVLGGHPEALAARPWQFVAKSPGIPYHQAFIAKLIQASHVIVTDVEIASWFETRPIYAITGSNGKTTTTTLVGEMLKASGYHPIVAGNIGTPVCDVVDQPGDLLVLEVSSFQLDGTHTFHPQGGALLNFYPAHIDYHGSYEAYQQAKWKLFANQTADDVAILNWDQALVRDRASQLAPRVCGFSLEGAPFDEGVGVIDGALVAVRGRERTAILPVEHVALPGRHNLQNAAAAAAVALAVGASVEAVARVLATFQGVEHRLEFVREVSGVRYYNDSKATNPDAARQALRSFERGIVWIAGGLDRGISFDPLLPDISGRVRAAVLLGETREQLRDVIARAGVPTCVLVSSMEEAVHEASRIAEAGDVVLLSPACASWDMFPSYEVRGSMFKEAVHRL